ncbi:MAG: NAD(+) synthase [Oscillospiraceae bacterium]|nr:NAD(+) synthase [Oscillospiraceae bacterium]
MQDGFIRVAAASVAVTVADAVDNAQKIRARIDQAQANQVNLLVLPELCVTGYTCGDLFYSDLLLRAAEEQVLALRDYTKGKYPVVVVGFPLRLQGKLYNCAAVLHDGRVLGVVPKTWLPNYGEFYEKRQFTSGARYNGAAEIPFGGETVPFGTDLVFRCAGLDDFCLGVELCEDVWATETPSKRLCLAGATVIANASASDEVIGKAEYRRMLICATAARLVCGYVYANAAPEESTQDMVFSAHHLISENGALLAEKKPFAPEDDLLITELDLFHLRSERHRNTSFDASGSAPCRTVVFDQPVRETPLSRKFAKHPFVPADGAILAERAEMILQMQSYGLKKRIAHTRCKTVVVGISGGLDSTLALLVMVRAMDMLGRARRDIVAVTMPCFGTTQRTKSNAVRLCELLGVTVRTVDITASVRSHFADIGHDEAVTDVTYENCQARERTQVLMDIANETGGIVVGTGDLSELALGWATYNGDHMSMYGVNASIPKTLVRYIIRYEAHSAGLELAEVLEDILATPVSPELLPASASGEMTQKTEDLVGPYELHDFFLYYMLRYGARPRKLYRLAKLAFAGLYDDATILHWLEVFTRRFFAQQFKRSCLPDSVKVGTVTLSPRGDWRMPSDASSRMWLDEIAALKQ